MFRAGTTNLKKLRGGHGFTWGRVMDFYEIGNYTILKFHPWISEDGVIKTGKPDTQEISYHGWIDGEDSHHSFDSLDAALAGLIGYRNLGPNDGPKAGHFFMKMINK
jgi:hypothetical protein